MASLNRTSHPIPQQSFTPSLNRQVKSRLSSFHRRSISRALLTPRPTNSSHLKLTSPSPRSTRSRRSIGPNVLPTPSRTPSTRRRSSRGGRVAQISKAEIEQMYANTIKMCQDNKINAKNTWNLDLIDYMGMLFRTESAGGGNRGVLRGETNFHRAGVTLDAGVKIYCSRVDSVHSNALKMLGGLSRTGGQTDAVDDEITEEGEGENGNRRRNRRRTGRATLENNLANITTTRLETDLTVDPLFQKMTAAFDEGGAKGMLLNNLPIGPRGQVVFDSGELADSLVGGDHACEDVYDVCGALPLFEKEETDDLCPRFLRFYTAKQHQTGTESQEVSANQGVANGFDSEVSNDVTFVYENGDLENSALVPRICSDEILEVPTLQEQMGSEDDVDVFESDDAVGMDSTLNSRISFAVASRGNMDLVEAGLGLIETSEYSFFDAQAMSGWAGPVHWRFKATEARIGTDPKKKAKRPRGKNAMLLDFSEAAPKVDFHKQFAQGKKETSYHLSKIARSSFSEKKITLPEDLHYSVRTLRSLFLRPKVHIRLGDSRRTRSAEAEVVETEEGGGWYDFDNDCDNENYCPENETGQEFGQESSNVLQDNIVSTEIDLLPEPTRVDKIDINYAKVAKKVDVRKLKSGIWSRLCGDGSQAPQGDVSLGTEPDSQTSESGDVRQGDPQTLRALVRDMPSFVPESSREDVTLPYMFMCLLHLANEKTLHIIQTGNGTAQDLVITSSVPTTQCDVPDASPLQEYDNENVPLVLNVEPSPSSIGE